MASDNGLWPGCHSYWVAFARWASITKHSCLAPITYLLAESDSYGVGFVISTPGPCGHSTTVRARNPAGVFCTVIPGWKRRIPSDLRS